LIMQAAAKHGILRVKGFVRIAGKPMRYLVQAVGARVSGHFDGPATGGEGRVVVIGRHGLDRADILASLEGERFASVG
jgi:cobalamin biosynthesis protein CobW